MSENKLTYRWREPISAIGLQAPFPLVYHLIYTDGLHLLPNDGLEQLDRCNSVRVEPATIVAYLVGTLLERRDMPSYEGRDEVVRLQLALLDELEDMVVVALNLSSAVS